ncbi:splicing factor U2AF 23 kDa subunit [Aspergillus awamori]|uniref:Splicing factor U2AF 23 kDa subunit n=1 Tax=Aspergillus awamori TaxID=105351 RepID=A0A401L607_ASPAW|nr:splicing factor U2AF 23 kDa subunit [Aspergillus awamori]
MPTVILGGGIIGSSIAYYLSQSQPQEEIHVIESASELFCSASGYAAGFLAKDWFAPSLAPLGELSFNLHESLAAEHGGRQKWGYMKGVALSLGSVSNKGGARGDDWLRAGTSRAETAAGTSQYGEPQVPEWLTQQQGAKVEQISDKDTTGQVDPLRLCRFLMDSCTSRGVKLHYPTKASSLVRNEAGTITGVRIVNLNTKSESTIPCTNLVVCAGPWTPQVFRDLFPFSKVALPIYPLAGYSLVLHSPRHTLEHEQKKYHGETHALFTTWPPSCGFSPELFSREGREIYIAGLNTKTIPLPERADDSHNSVDQKEMDRLKAASVRLLGKLADGKTESSDETPNLNDLKIVREGLCFRPASDRGTPFVGRIDDSLLGEGIKTATGSRKGGVFVASGHGPWGISLALGTGKVIADLVEGVQPAVDISGLGILDLSTYIHFLLPSSSPSPRTELGATRFTMANYLASIFGTEQDKVNCSFYYKIGACRHGDRCSRKHVKPSYSQTILMPNMYQNPAYDPKSKMNPSQLQNHFDAFYEDVWCEMCKYGELEELVVCDNNNDHLIGNVYARFKYEEDAQAACDALNSRCGEGCVRGGFCNFIHRKDPSNELDRDLRLSTKKWLKERGRDARSVSRSPSPEPTRRRY